MEGAIMNQIQKIGLIFSLCLMIFSVPAHALMELSGSFSYDRTIYGAQRQNKQIDRTWIGTIAVFLFEKTALELNYTYGDEITQENEVIPISGFNLNQISTEGKVNSEVFGVGLRQVFSGRQARFKPSLSLGYAKQFIRSESTSTYQDTSNSNILIFKSDPSKSRIDSVFATFAIQFGLTKRISLRGSVNTLFEADDFNSAKDNLKYMAGFSWVL